MASLDERIERLEGSSSAGDPREALKGRLTVKLDFEGVRIAMTERGVKPSAGGLSKAGAVMRSLLKRGS